MDTNSLYPALSEQVLYNCIQTAMKKEWNSTNSTTNFFHRNCCAKHKKRDRQKPGLLREEIRCSEMICLSSKTYCCSDSKPNKFKHSSKSLKRRTIEDCGDGCMSQYRKVLEEVVKVTSSAKRGFRTLQLAVSAYEQTKKACHTFIPEQMFNKKENTLVHAIYNYRQCKILIQFLWITKNFLGCHL